MKLLDIAQNIDKSKNNQVWIDSEVIACEIGVDQDAIYLDEQTRLKCYWVGNWCCTDTYVGYRMYFLDDEPVAFSIQSGRKCDEDIKWFSKELFIKVRRYIFELVANEAEDLKVATCDINEDVGTGYKIQFNAQVLNWENARLNGEKVTIVERIKDDPDWEIDSTLKIGLESSKKEQIIDIKDIEFQFHLKRDI
jgi:hypothetical protein